MNYKKDGAWCSPEIREWKIVRKFEREEFSANFHLVMKCEAGTGLSFSRYPPSQSYQNGRLKIVSLIKQMTPAEQLSFTINGEPISVVFPIQIPLSEGKNVVLRCEGPPGRWKMLKLPAIKENQVSNKDSFDIPANEDIPLEEALSVGDSIGVWGKFSSEGRFSFNIVRPKADYLLHIDVRPEAGTVVIDSSVDGNWGTINKHLSEAFQDLVEKDGDFHIKIDFKEQGMLIYINGKDIGVTAPYEFDLCSATYIICQSKEGLSSSPWQRIKLPKPRQILQTFGTYEFNQLSIGDVLNLTAHYRTSETVAVNIMCNPHTILLHISIRPGEGQVVLNTSVKGGWGAEIRAAIPAELTDGQLFDIFVMVCEKEFKLEFSRDEDNGNVLLEMRMPHRAPCNQPGYVNFRDVQDNVWTELNMPDGTSYSREV